MEFFVRHGPGDVQGQPVVHGEEYTGFIVDCYMVGDHPSNNHLIYDSAFLSRPKGCDKSGLGARLALFEALGPCRFAGWAKGGEVYRDPWGLGFVYVYEPGEPMGKPVTAPMIRCLATEEGQAASNVFATIHFNLTDDEYEPPLSFVPNVDSGVDKILLPNGGDIRVSTASSSAKDGGKETFCILDETHLYTTPELKRMYRTITRNMRKRKKGSGTWFFECTTMFAPGEESMAESTYTEAETLREGRKKRGRHRLMYDHRWGECADLTDEAALRAALIEAYGDAVEWIDIDGLIDEFYDTRNLVADSRRYFLNARTSASDAWIAEHEWAACKRPGAGLKRRDLVTLGFDGSIGGDNGRSDATALVACRVSDGHIELIGLWEKPEDYIGEGWRVDQQAVDAAVANAMKYFDVCGFYADPAHWQSWLDLWHKQWSEKMRVQSSKSKPIEFWTNRPTVMVAALERFHQAVLDGMIGFTPPEDRGDGTEEQQKALALTRHVGNARREPSRAGLQIRKEHPKSPKRIDAAVAAVLAYEAAGEARAQGLKPTGAELQVPRRIR